MLIVSRLVIQPLKIFTEAAKEVTKGNLDVKVNIEGSDEIGQLAKSFNGMLIELQGARENIEKKVAERTADLEKINNFMVGREIKMIDLKKQINELTKNQSQKN
jgi:nitrate/nitrite-specific signal transduction histidine kinase